MPLCRLDLPCCPDGAVEVCTLAAYCGPNRSSATAASKSTPLQKSPAAQAAADAL